MAATIISGPATRLDDKGSIFLAGSTSPMREADWRETLTAALIDLPIVRYNPKRTYWELHRVEDFSDRRWTEQVQWEFEMQNKADIVVIVFHEDTIAPISLLEFGLVARTGKAIACVHSEYMNRGYVEEVCRQYGVRMVSSEEDLKVTVRDRLETLVAGRNASYSR